MSILKSYLLTDELFGWLRNIERVYYSKLKGDIFRLPQSLGMIAFFYLVDIMIEFLKESDTFNSIVFNGNYDMPLDALGKIYNHYQETGENLLDDYSFVVYKTWERNDEFKMLSHEEFNNAFIKISKLRSLHLKDFDIVHEAMYVCRQQLKRWQRWKEINSTRYKKRVNANKFIANNEIRETVFELHGEQCLCCGSTDDLQIDHIKSVHNGGENEIDNLQPLCKSCNVSKGTKMIDYR